MFHLTYIRIIRFTFNLSAYFQELSKCENTTTGFVDGLSSETDLLAGKSWFPLLDLKPSCNSFGTYYIMTSASLEKNGTDLRYNYSCCDFEIQLRQVTVNSTNWEYGTIGLTNAISKCPIDCGKFAFITSFQLERDSSNIRYSYTCYEVLDQHLMQCKTNATRRVVQNEFSTFTLAEVPVLCDAGFGLSWLQLQIEHGLWGFNFRCCKAAY